MADGDHSDYSIATSLTTYVFKLIDAEEKRTGRPLSRAVINTFLATFIGAVVHRTLSARPKGNKSKKEIADEVTDNFREVKGDIQTAVAAGFQGAMNTFSGREVDYYCQIQMIPEPLNKEPI